MHGIRGMLMAAALAPLCWTLGEGLAVAGEAPPAAAKPAYVFVERVPERSEGELPVLWPVAAGDPRLGQLGALMERPFVRWVLEVGALARRRALERCTAAPEVCAARFDHPPYFQLREGGNFPRQGFALLTVGEDGEQVRALPETWYVEVDPEELATLVPHEYGHLMMFELLPGDAPPHPDILPHTTGAITQDVTAFSEGWGIHFETLAADRPENAELRAHQLRDVFPTEGEYRSGDSLRAALDLMSYSQSFRRYGCIKENCFAYLPRPRPEVLLGGPPTPQDLLGRWTDATYDPARLRTLEQMVASEGLLATLFYRLATAPAEAPAPGASPPLPPVERYAAFFDAFATLSEERMAATPAALAFLESLLAAAAPPERRRIARVTLEVMHLTPLLADAPERYGQLHAAGHLLDVERFQQLRAALAEEMERGVERLAADPSLLATAAAPELWLTHREIRVGFAAFGGDGVPLAFDLNTAPLEVLLTVPGITVPEARAIAAARARGGGFATLAEAAEVAGLRRQTVQALQRMAGHLQ